jgi:hypothetical protein
VISAAFTTHCKAHLTMQTISLSPVPTATYVKARI